MFTLQEQQNPLQQLLGSIGTGLAKGGLESYKERDRTERFKNTVGKLPVDASPMDLINAIGQLPLDEQTQALKMVETATGIEAKRKKGEVKPENLEVIREIFGDEVADLYPTLTTGGQTHLAKSALEAKQRGTKLLDKVEESGVNEPNQPEVDEFGERPIQIGPPKGLTPKEIVDWRKDTRKENLPLYHEAGKKVKAWKRDRIEIGVLQKLNDKLPEGLQKLVINPLTGEPYNLAKLTGKVPAPVVRWVKTINDFTKNAKDSYGSRVTNFDLQQFLKRFPSILDTPEARAQVLKQMALVGELDQLYEDALHQVYNKHGVGNIAPEEADRLAERAIAKRRDEIRAEVEAIGDDLESKHEESFGIANDQEGVNELPDPTKHKKIQDDQGNVYISNGKEWIKQ